jgi:RNA polymerase sigma-70 factor (ECF subfamily)
MRAVRDGDVAKLAPLFERHHASLFEFLSRMTGNATAAEDLVQDVFVRVLKYRATFRDDGRFETWLFRIARNARADYFKRRGVPPVDLNDIEEPPAATASVADTLEHAADVARLKQALLALREDKRELIVLARYRGMKYEAIADLLGVEVGTVKTRMHRAVNELRKIFLGLTEKGPCSVKQPENGLLMV